jgi:histidinol-phosphate aminotransferase
VTPPSASTGVTFDLTALVRPAVRAIPSYIPPKAPHQHLSRVVKLDLNESPFGPSPKARTALASFEATNRYPDFAQTALREALARYTGMPAEQIVCGAGLDDVLNTLAHLILDEGDEVIIHEPTFGVYRMLAALHGSRAIDAPLGDGFALDPDRVLAAVTKRTKLVILCTPNNPTGNLLDPDAVETVVANAPCLVAIDEAYAEFAGTSHLPLMQRYPNVIILRTMSKFAGLAGMRVGYGIFPAALVPHLHAVIPPFHNVSLPSALAAIASLEDLPFLMENVARIVAARDALSAQLRAIPGVEPLPSATNFLLVRLPVEDAQPIVAALAERGVLVRYFGRPELGIRDCLRVTVGLPEENEVFVHTLREILASGGTST